MTSVCTTYSEYLKYKTSTDYFPVLTRLVWCNLEKYNITYHGSHIILYFFHNETSFFSIIYFICCFDFHI